MAFLSLAGVEPYGINIRSPSGGDRIERWNNFCHEKLDNELDNGQQHLN
jgi:hypothetical protein